MCVSFFFFKQNTAYEMRISDWSSDVCSSDLCWKIAADHIVLRTPFGQHARGQSADDLQDPLVDGGHDRPSTEGEYPRRITDDEALAVVHREAPGALR